MDGWKKLALVVLGMAAGCAPVRPAGPEAGGAERGVEVVNMGPERVHVYASVPGSTGTELLGTVGAGSRRQFRLPPLVRSVSLKTADGRFVSRPEQVRVHHIRL